jgi:hypothetical protein
VSAKDLHPIIQELLGVVTMPSSPIVRRRPRHVSLPMFRQRQTKYISSSNDQLCFSNNSMTVLPDSPVESPKSFSNIAATTTKSIKSTTQITKVFVSNTTNSDIRIEDSWLQDWAQATIAAAWRGKKQRVTYYRLRRRYRRGRNAQKMQTLNSKTQKRSKTHNNTRTAIQKLAQLKRKEIEQKEARDAVFLRL